MRSFGKWISLAAGLILVMGLAACGTKGVPLTYEPVIDSTYPCSTPLTVVKFNDVREEKVLGEGKNGRAIEAANDPAEWVSKALVQELERAGCQVTYEATPPANPTGYLITGNLEQLFFKRPAYASYYTYLELKVMLAQDEWTTFTQSYKVSTNEDGKAPDESKVLERDLQEAMQKIVPELMARIK